MKFRFPLLFVAAAVGLALSGCQLPFQQAVQNVENSRQLRVGMTKIQVLEIMGEPLSGETFCEPDTWYYYIRTVWADGLTTRDECMPLVFSDGKLIGWGNRFHTEYRSRGVRGELDETPGDANLSALPTVNL